MKFFSCAVKTLKPSSLAQLISKRAVITLRGHTVHSNITILATYELG